jgi:glycerate 2-kinase
MNVSIIKLPMTRRLKAMNRILNAEALTSHGNVAGRQALIEILEAGLRASDPYHSTRKLIHVEGNRLIVGGADFEPPGSPRSGDEVLDLDEIGRIFVFGAGKGIQRMAKALEDVLGDRLTGGHVIDKQGAECILERIEVTFGAHPVPDVACINGCQRILEMTADLTKNDLVFTMVSNGVSSLLTLPAPGISLEELQRLTYIFQIERGGPTIDLIPIRNHLDQMKGGRFSRHLQPARVFHLLAFHHDDYPKLMTDPSYRWLHTLPDMTTGADAVRALKKWDVWDDAAPSIRAHLTNENPSLRALTIDEFEAMDSRIFCVSPEHLGMAPTVRKKAAELGFTPHVLYSNFTMLPEASQVGMFVANLAKHSEFDGDPFEPPCALISHGELIVTVGDENGMGGRNQEYAISAARELAGTYHVIMGSIDSDGTDGPGHQFVDGHEDVPVLAGAIVDESTLARAEESDYDLFDALKRHDTSPALHALDDGIIASPSLSMCDLSVTLILDRQAR